MDRLDLLLLGPPLIQKGGRQLNIAPRKTLALLAYLAVSGKDQSRDALATLFWPEQDQSRARASLRHSLWLLGRAGLQEWLQTEQDNVCLRPGYTLDVTSFYEKVNSCTRHGHARDEVCPDCLEPLSQAVALYRDDFLAGFTLRDSPDFDEWQLFQAESHRQVLADVLERLVRLSDSQGDWEQGIGYGRRLAALDPLHEPAHRWLMRLYARSGKRALALKQFETLRQALAQELGIEPDEESQRLYDDILAHRSPEGTERAEALAPQPAAQRPRHSLPIRLTSFIGREREITELTRLFSDRRPDTLPVRLVTLTGTGGSGKTRLALRVAGDLVDRFPDGVFFVDLAPINQPELVPFVIARALRLAETRGQSILESLKDHLRPREMLLLLDNFEHLIEAAPLVAELLTTAPGLHALVTSRELLHLSGERAYPVPPLALPPLEANEPLSAFLRHESVQLFVQRAKSVRPDFEITTANAPLVAEICVHLDGLPLAIELAAARMRVLTLEALRAQLSDRFQTLRGGPRDMHARQQTLRATIDWSYNLLDAETQALLARLSVFQGDRTVEAVEQVCVPGLSLNAVDGLESLLDKSLLHQVDGAGGEPRYVLLETIHEYAREKLEERGETEALRQRHAAYYLALAQEAERHLWGGPNQVQWLRRIEAEHANVRAVLEWALNGHDTALGLRVVATLHWFWIRQGRHAEGRWWNTRALEQSAGADLKVRAQLLLAAGVLSYFQQKPSAGVAPLEEAVALFRELGNEVDTAWAQAFLGGVQGFAVPDKYEASVALMQKSLAILRAADDRPRIAQVLNYLGELTRAHGDYATAKALYEECLALSSALGDTLREQMNYINLGYIAQHEQNYEEAKRLFRTALTIALKMESKFHVVETMAVLGGAIGIHGQPQRAARLMGAAEALLEEMGIVLQPADQLEYQRYRDAVREQLGEANLAAAWAEGRAMAWEDAIAEVLADA